LSESATETHRPPPTALDARLTGFLRERWGAAAEGLTVTPLAGDASTRCYFRLRDAEGGAPRVLALYPEPLPAGPVAFLDVHRLLELWGLPVPQVLACDRARGVMLLSDLGDLSLQEFMRGADDTERERVYAQALHQVDHLQRSAAGWPERAAECFQVAFDVAKLRWELDYFVAHFVTGLRARALTDDERNELDAAFALLCREMASWPRVLCHRDFHSRNLLLHGGAPAWIDFQDARMGPATYDLASLLRDAYVTLPEDFIAERAEEFRTLALSGVARATFARRFDWTCVQRNLKALGTFGCMTAVRGKDVYLRYVAPTLRHVRRNLGRHAEFDGLRRVLARHIEELT
jgi:hypothetical protein